MAKRRRDSSTSPGPSKKSRAPTISSQKSEGNTSSEQIKEWEDATCPVCLEHPHNAVLLICSSYAKGCRPYMCNTSQLHSNCLDKFCKSFEETPNAAAIAAESSSEASTLSTNGKEEEVNQGVNSFPSMHKLEHNLVCPLCRGQISGWTVVQGARDLMNAKTRSCACESCEFSGNYRDLRKHARIEHPQARPSEADPERELDWRHREWQSDIQDMIDIIRSSLGVPEGSDVDEDLGNNPEHQVVDSDNIQDLPEGGDEEEEEEELGPFTILLLVRFPRNNGRSGASRPRSPGGGVEEQDDGPAVG